MACVGIFFLVDATWLIDAVPAVQGEPYGDAIEHGGHYGLLGIPRAQHSRGAPVRRATTTTSSPGAGSSVLFPPAAQTYRVCVDNCHRLDVLAAFGLTRESAVLEGNGDGTLLVCATCHPESLE